MKTQRQSVTTAWWLVGWGRRREEEEFYNRRCVGWSEEQKWDYNTF